jgi:small subunit ribosomal protein S13
MARIVGVEIPDTKKIKISLRYIFGIGPKISAQILDATGISPETRTKDLGDAQIAKLYEYIEKNVVNEGELRQKVFRDVKRLRDIRSFRGNRHKAGLPVRGQNTRKNARTRKGKVKAAVGGLNNKITKK